MRLLRSYPLFVCSILILGASLLGQQKGPRRLRVSPQDVSIAPGSSMQYRALLSFFSGAEKGGERDVTSSVQWSSDNAAVAITPAGNATAGTPPALPVTAHITAQLGPLQKTVTLTVTSATLSSVSVSPAGSSVPLGLGRQLAAIGNYSDGSTHDLSDVVTWSSSDTTVATVNAFGFVNAVNPNSNTLPASTTITATCTGGATGCGAATISGNTTFTVNVPQLVSVSVTPSSVTLIAPATQQFTATGNFTDGTSLNLTASCAWTSSNKPVATIGASTGLATAVAGGSATITANCSGVTSTAMLKVISLVSVTVSPASASLAVGATKNFTATANYSDSSTQDVTASASWISVDSTIAGVGNTGAQKGLVTAVAPGSTTISATFSALPGSASVKVTTTSDYISVQSPGDIWNLTFNDTANTFSAMDQTTGANYSGTLLPLPNGFLQTTITASNDPSRPAGTVGYAVEVPTIAATIALAGSNDKPIKGITESACPSFSGTTTLQAVNLGKSTYNSAQSESYAIVSVSQSGLNYNSSYQSFTLNGTLRSESGTLPQGTCQGNSIVIPNVPAGGGVTRTVTVMVSPTGLIGMDLGVGHGAAVGSQTPLGAADIATIVSQQYIGVLNKRNSTPVTTFVGFGPGSGSSIQGGSYANITTDPFSAHATNVNISLSGTNAQGFLLGTIVDGNGTHTPFVALATKNGGKYFLFGITTDTSTTTPYVVILAQH